MNRILIVEDEAAMARLLSQALSESGFECEVASDGASGLAMAGDADLILADVMMPVLNGFTMVEQLRATGNRVPVIYLTARDSTADLVKGLELGGDDYLVKPFKLEELIARIRASLRRAREASHVLSWQDIRMDCTKRTAFRNGVEMFLSATEFVLLELFMRRPKAVLPKTLILEQVWQDEGYRDENIVEVYINYLRRKTEALGPRVIQTVRGRGYVLASNELDA